jgi:hypothetical protein
LTIPATGCYKRPYYKHIPYRHYRSIDDYVLYG